MDNLYLNLLGMRDKLAARVKAQYPAEPWLSQEDLEHLLVLLQLTIERTPAWTPITTLPPMRPGSYGVTTAEPLLLLLSNGDIDRGYLVQRPCGGELIIVDDNDDLVFHTPNIVAWIPVATVDDAIRNRPMPRVCRGGG